jgi:DNA repair photolyase
MEGRLFKTGLTLRGDHYYCPLALQLSTYWNCEVGCASCYLRRMNRTWGSELRPLDTSVLVNQMVVGDRARNSLANAIRARKTVYVGAKTDPYQPAEEKYEATRRALDVLLSHGFSIVVATKFPTRAKRDYSMFREYRSLVSIMPIISPGWGADWAKLEGGRTERPDSRLEAAVWWAAEGFNVGVNGEPFIPGFHTEDEFRVAVKRIRRAGIRSYNTYNLHFNDWNMKALHAAGVDVEKINDLNRGRAPELDLADDDWPQILPRLIKIAQDEGIVLGCPDFVNSGAYTEPSEVNTCCGLRVPNPCTMNFITWKRMRAQGLSDSAILGNSYDGVGDSEEAAELLKGDVKNLYTLKDVQ